MTSTNLRSQCQYFDNNGKKFKPTLFPTKGFSAKQDAAALCSAMRCWGTDEDAIIKILGKRTCVERQQIVEAYKADFKRELAHDLDGELSGNFRDLALLLVETPSYLMAKSLFYAMKGVGTNENTIIEILVSCSQEEIKQLKISYVYVLRDKKIKDPKRSLESDIRAETSGNFGKMCLQILKGETPDPTPQQLQALEKQGAASMIDAASAAADARVLFSTNGKSKQAIETAYLQVFNKKHIWQLSAIATEFEKLAHKSLIETMQASIEGEFGTLLIAMVEHASNRSKFFSDLLYHSMLGAGTHDFLLIRIMVLRSEIDLGNIKETYDKDHTSLENDIKGDTSGDYEKLLLTILGVVN